MATGFSVVDALSKNSKQGVEETPRARFRTKDISIHKIYSNSKNFYPQEGIEEKAAEILAVGMLENIAVMYAPEEQGEYRIISGERRWRALKMLDVSDSDTDSPGDERPEEAAEDGRKEAAESELIPEPYEDPHPIGITSLCYGCQKYLDCNVRTSTCTSCDQYINKAEAEKTDEQRYDDEQARIDRQTRARIREMEDEEKMKHLPSEEKKREAVIEFLAACDAMCVGRHCDMYEPDSTLQCPLYKWCNGMIFPMGEKGIREFVDVVENRREKRE